MKRETRNGEAIDIVKSCHGAIQQETAYFDYAHFDFRLLRLRSVRRSASQHK